ncbi:MAG: MBL fold metallo-hydrolase [Clostridiaceae bacterium]|jgi:metallo-beta-lactamase family protein|nr:MBL fold metallo-hydrolase [Clostridiaceae bacterium]
MKISFLGAAKTVTGSCFHIETDTCSFLVDCGMFQGSSADEARNHDPFPFNPADLDFVVLTHAHVDHSGRLPKLYIDGFQGPIFATKATAELCAIMLPDSGHIQEFENEWVNRKRERAGLPPVRPLYTVRDAIDCIRLFKRVRYYEEIRINDRIRMKFNDGGHLLGSSIVELWVRENGREIKLVFSGDLGNRDMPILRDPDIIESADYVFIESTYGNRDHVRSDNKADKFLEIIRSTKEKGGNVIIPSFAVGRTQEIIYELFKQHEKNDEELKQLLQIPVYVDSPLAVSATEVFRNNLDCFDEEAREYIKNGDNPLDFPGLRFTRSAEESKALNESKESLIIISASGMCEAGRIKHHLKHNLWRKESSIVFVGYQAAGTLGRRILDGAKKVRIFGEEINVDARVEMLEGLSGHADQTGLISWLKSFRQKPRNIFVVHGEEEAVKQFGDLIFRELDIVPIAPEYGESFMVTADGVAPADRKADRREKRERYGFRRLEIVHMLDKLKDELEEASAIIRDDLRTEKDDIELDKLLEKLLTFEKYIVEIIK